ncbi:TSUP family transporter [Neiella marina]|uniref:Probable membrane transporter protein n=1 Tax=Neiella holothuriorum TaxID=2870530 RepID=A0ABS7EEZ8_9GAMM|nr:TSUP family transporter [Neiella holothuriorum]MBW8190914.1 TSUP family transporter [Neiella holothuriorum]
MLDLVSTDIWVMLSLAALLAGFIDAIAGGGGLLTIPALLFTGMPPHLALGTNKLAATFGSCTASITFYRKRLFFPQRWRWAMVCTAIGAMLGTIAAYNISSQALEKALPAIVLCTAIYTLITKLKDESNGNEFAAEASPLKQGLQGVGLGFYDGIAGPGTGAFWTLSTLKLHKLNLLFSSGVARTMNFISNAVSLVTFVILGQVNWLVGLSMGLCIMTGAYLGAHSAIRFGANLIRPVFILGVSAMAIKLCWDAWL